MTGSGIASLGTVLEDVGAPRLGQPLRAYGESVQQANPSSISRLGDLIDKPSAFIGESLGQLGAQLPISMAGSAAGARLGLALPLPPQFKPVAAAIGGIGGAFMPNWVGEYGETRANQRETGMNDPALAAKTSALAAGFDTAGDLFAMRKFFNPAVGQVAREVLPEGASRLGNIAKEFGKTALVEGGTEIPQTALERLGGGKDLNSPEAWNDYGVGFGMGAVGGGIAGGLGGAMQPRAPVDAQNQTDIEQPADVGEPLQPEQPPGLGTQFQPDPLAAERDTNAPLTVGMTPEEEAALNPQSPLVPPSSPELDATATTENPPAVDPIQGLGSKFQINPNQPVLGDINESTAPLPETGTNRMGVAGPETATTPANPTTGPDESRVRDDGLFSSTNQFATAPGLATDPSPGADAGRLATEGTAAGQDTGLVGEQPPAITETQNEANTNAPLVGSQEVAPEQVTEQATAQEEERKPWRDVFADEPNSAMQGQILRTVVKRTQNPQDLADVLDSVNPQTMADSGNVADDVLRSPYATDETKAKAKALVDAIPDLKNMDEPAEAKSADDWLNIHKNTRTVYDAEGIPSRVYDQATEQEQPPARGREDIAGTTEQKQPWQMTAQEWDKEYEKTRSDSAQSNFTRNSGSEAVGKFNRADYLRYDARSEEKRQIQEAREGKIKLTPNEVADLDERLNTPIRHEDVVRKALAEGQPVPPEVLADYPDLQEPTNANTRDTGGDAASLLSGDTATTGGELGAEGSLGGTGLGDSVDGAGGIGTEPALAPGQADSNPVGGPALEQKITVDEAQTKQTKPDLVEKPALTPQISETDKDNRFNLTNVQDLGGVEAVRARLTQAGVKVPGNAIDDNTLQFHNSQRDKIAQALTPVQTNDEPLQLSGQSEPAQGQTQAQEEVAPELRDGIAQSNSASNSGNVTGNVSATLEPWQQSLDDFANQQVEQSPYAETYRNQPKLADNFKQQQSDKWVNALKQRANEGRVDDAALDDFVGRYGVQALQNTFRGQYEKGIEGYMPPDVRAETVESRPVAPQDKPAHEMTWAEYRKYHTPDGFPDNAAKTPAYWKALKQQHRNQIARKFEQIPEAVRADYPDLFPTNKATSPVTGEAVTGEVPTLNIAQRGQFNGANAVLRKLGKPELTEAQWLAEQQSKHRVNATEEAGQWELQRYEERKTNSEDQATNGEIITRRVGDWDNAETSAGSGRGIVNVYWLKNKQTGEVRPFGSDTAYQAMGVSQDGAKSKAQKLLQEQRDYNHNRLKGFVSTFANAGNIPAADAHRLYKKLEGYAKGNISLDEAMGLVEQKIGRKPLRMWINEKPGAAPTVGAEQKAPATNIGAKQSFTVESPAFGPAKSSQEAIDAANQGQADDITLETVQRPNGVYHTALVSDGQGRFDSVPIGASLDGWNADRIRQAATTARDSRLKLEGQGQARRAETAQKAQDMGIKVGQRWDKPSAYIAGKKPLQTYDWAEVKAINPETGEVTLEAKRRGKIERITTDADSRFFDNYPTPKAPSVYDDPRMKRGIYRNALSSFKGEITKGGDVAYLTGEDGKISGRTKSVNAQWFQTLPDDTKMSVEQAQKAIDKAVEGKKLGVREERLIVRLLDQIGEERNAAVDYTKGQRDEMRAKRAQEKAAHDLVRQTLGLDNDTSVNLGYEHLEADYEPEHSHETRIIGDLAQQYRAMPDADENWLESLLERDIDDAEIAKQLQEQINGRAREGSVEANPQVEGQSANQAGLFPDATAEERTKSQAEALAEAQREQQRRSNATQAPPADEGIFALDNRQDELFSERQEPEPATPAQPKTRAEKLRASRTTAQTATTEDAGEELTANRRNRIRTGIRWDDIKDKNESLRVKETTKANVYPKPDWATLSEDMNPMSAYLVKTVYDRISSTPQKLAPTDTDLQAYIAGIHRIMSAVMDWAKDAQYVSNFKVASNGQDLLSVVYPDGWLKASDAEKAEIRLLGGNRFWKSLQPGYDERVRAEKDIKDGWPAKKEAWQKQGYSVIARDGVSVLEGNRGKFWVKLESNGKYFGLHSSHDTRAEAQSVIDSMKPWLTLNKRGQVIGQEDTQEAAINVARDATKRTQKPSISEKGISVELAQRVGPDYRQPGEDISSDRLKDTFGFRGVNFGEWMKGKSNEDERQLHLNHAYDSMMDLSTLLNVPPKALSMNGILGMAVGAQGQGKYAAHFVPGVNEINLTRTSGAGSLAHEWGHALDHYFATQAGLSRAADPFITEHVRPGEADAKMGDGIRPEMVNRIKEIVSAMRRREQTPAEAEAERVAGLQKARSSLDMWIRAFDRNTGLAENPDYAALMDRLRNQDIGDGTVYISKKHYVSPVVAELYKVVKEQKVKYPTDQFYGLYWAARMVKHAAESIDASGTHQPQMTDTDYMKEAKKLDADKKGKKYWSTPWEMFARAFDAYVSDKIAEKSEKNSYLSHAGRQDSTTPAGTERTAINEAFDALVNEIKTKETDQGVAMFSRQPTFYSQLARSFESAKPEAMPGTQWLAWLRGNASKLGVKADEIAWTGIEDYLAMRGKEKTTKADISAFLADNGVQVEEVMRGETDYGEVEAWWTDEGGANEETPFDELTPQEQREAAERYAQEVGQYDENGTGTKFSTYTLPGGTNYRELLITLPVASTIEPVIAEGRWRLRNKANGEFVRINGSVVGFNSQQEAQEAIQQLSDPGMAGYAPGYKSSHWDEQNVLAHIRFDERTDADGKRVMFITELQSDWGQEGKKRGFAGSVDADHIASLRAKHEALNSLAEGPLADIRASGKTIQEIRDERQRVGAEIVDAEAKLKSATIPPAPFVTDTKSWLSLGLKRAIRYAAENGFDKIAFANGQQNADLYDLSKQVDTLQYAKSEDGTYMLNTVIGGRNDLLGSGITEDKLEDYVGKEIAEKIVASKGRTSKDGGWKTLSGLDLKVGGEGMRTFYDQIVPQTANDVLKKLGGPRVGSVDFPAGKPTIEKAGSSYYQVPSKVQATTQPGFTITPELRERAMGGLPLFRSSQQKVSSVLSRDAVKARAEAIRSRLKISPDVEIDVRATEAELPEEILAQAKKEGALGEVVAVHHKGTIYLVADRHSSDLKIEESLLHEGTHYGADALFGRTKQVAYTNLYFKLGREQGLRDLAAKMNIRMDGYFATANGLRKAGKITEGQRFSYLIDEFLAHANGNKAYATLPQKIKTAIQEFYGAIRNWLRTNGFAELSNFNDSDLAYLLRNLSRATQGRNGDSRPMFMVAWHGSPHDHNKFSTDKIGTGEGAAAFGWGLYFSNSREIADYYRERLTENSTIKYKNVEVERAEYSTRVDGVSEFVSDVINALEYQYGNPQGAKEYLRAELERMASPDSSVIAEVRAYAAKSLNNFDKKFDRVAKDVDIQRGKLYQVELAPKDNEYLDWNKPLSEQSEKVREAIKDHLDYLTNRAEWKKASVLSRLFENREYQQKTGEEIYRDVEKEFGSDKAASEHLHSLGIRGIRYPAEGQTGGKSGDRTNYVIFSDDDVSITAKFSRSTPTINVDGTQRPTTNSNGQPIHPTEEGIRNFWRWFQNSAVVDAEGRPIPVYHGTNADFNEFSMSYFGQTDDGYYGRGFYFSQSEETAGEYGQRVIDAYLKSTNPLRLPDAGTMGHASLYDARDILADLYDMPERKVVRTLPKGYEVQSRTRENRYTGEEQTVYLVAPKEELWNTDKEIFGTEEFSEEAAIIEFNDEINDVGISAGWLPQMLKSFGRDSLSEVAQAKGYDSIFVVDADFSPGDIGEIVVFEPAQIKSTTNNNGDFSPTNPDIRFSRASGHWNTPVDSAMDNLIRKLQNKHIDTKRVVEAIKEARGSIEDRFDPELKIDLYDGRVANRLNEFLLNEVEPFYKALGQSGVSVDDLEKYLHARHAEERNEQMAKVNKAFPDGGSGMTNQEAWDYLASVPNRAVLDRLAAQVDAINNGTKRMLVDEGLETQSTIDTWDSVYQHYVPLFREEAEGEQRFGNGTGPGFSVRGSASKRAMGSSRNVVDILANSVMARERALTRSEKNRVSTALFGAAVQNPADDFWRAVDPDKSAMEDMQDWLQDQGLEDTEIEELWREPRKRVIDKRTGQVTYRLSVPDRFKDNVVALRIDGKDKFIFFNQDNPRALEMAKALKNLDTHDLGSILTGMRYVTRWISSVNTQFNPIFGITNIIRDTGAGLLNLESTELKGQQMAVLKEVPSALAGIYRDVRADRKGKARSNSEYSRLFEEYEAAGGETGYRDMFRTSQDRADALQKIIDPSAWADTKWGKLFTANGRLKVPIEMARKAAQPLFDWLSDYNRTLENSVRLAAYKVAKDNGMSKERAAQLAKNLTVNFNKKGQVAQQMGAMYAFFNASMQGSARIAETLLDKRGNLSESGKMIVQGGLLLGVAQALMLSGYDDDEPPEFVREKNFIIPLPDGKYASVPYPLGFHILPNTGRVLTDILMRGKPGDRVASLLGSFIDAFNPIGSAGMSMQTIAPTVFDPGVALAENKDWTGKPIAKENFSSLSPTPGFTRAKDTASWFGKVIAEMANTLSGGTDYVPGAFSPTPDQIDYLIGQATGGVGRELMKAQQFGSSLVSGEEIPPYKVPGLGRFFGSTNSQAAESSRFYDNLTHLNMVENTIRGLKKDGKPVQEYLRATPEARLVKLSNTIETDIRELRSKKRALLEKSAPKMQIQMIENAITTKMKRLNEAMSRIPQ